MGTLALRVMIEGLQIRYNVFGNQDSGCYVVIDSVFVCVCLCVVVWYVLGCCWPDWPPLICVSLIEVDDAFKRNVYSAIAIDKQFGRASAFYYAFEM